MQIIIHGNVAKKALYFKGLRVGTENMLTFYKLIYCRHKKMQILCMKPVLYYLCLFILYRVINSTVFKTNKLINVFFL